MDKTEYLILASEINELADVRAFNFPKYSTQMMNLFNQNAGGTKVSRIGSVVSMMDEYRATNDEFSVKGWERFVIAKNPNVFKEVGQRIYEMGVKMDAVPSYLDLEMCENYAYDLIINKTCKGLYYQEIIFKYLSKVKGCTFKRATLKNESDGIDGFLDDIPYQVKPLTFESKKSLTLPVNFGNLILYKPTSDGIKITVANPKFEYINLLEQK